MRALMKSDLFRNFLGGFVLGAVALVTLTPAEGAETLRDRIESIYKA
jgi:hypothetical protein